MKLLLQLGNDPDALSEIDGIAFHTYFDKYIPASTLDDLHKAYPNTSIYCTETSINTGWGEYKITVLINKSYIN